MQRTVYNLNKIEVMDFKPKEGVSKLRVIFTKNNEVKQILGDFMLSNPVEIVNKIILDIKKSGKMIVEDSDDLLQNIYITRLENEEELEEKMLYFFQNLCSKVSKIKTLKKAPDYMKVFDEIKTMKFIF